MRKWLVFLLIALALLMPADNGFAQIPEKPRDFSYVQDYAKILSAEQKRQMEEAGRALDQQTKAQVVAVTVPSLEGQAPEAYALAILRGWGIGDAKLNNGVLLLVATEDRISRIEVGYGLEGVLPDGKTGEIRDRYMLPYFQKNELGTGLMHGYMAVAEAARSEYPAQPVEAKPAENSYGWKELLLMIAAVVVFILDWMFFGGALTRLFLAILSSRRGGGGSGRYGGGSGGGGGSTGRW